VDPRPGLDDLETRKFLALHGFKLRPLSTSARSQSLYRLRYPGSKIYLKLDIKLDIKWIKIKIKIKITIIIKMAAP
jgi:hypothetical protein